MRYRIDSSDLLTDVDEEWLPFASANEAPTLTREVVLGRSLYSFISDSTTIHLWESILGNVRAGHPLDINLRCDSADSIRYVRLRASADVDGSVAFSSDMLSATPREPLPMPTAKSFGGIHTLCSWCKRLRLPDGEWVPLHEGVTQLNLFGGDAPGLISHGMCENCLESVLASQKDPVPSS